MSFTGREESCIIESIEGNGQSSSQKHKLVSVIVKVYEEFLRKK